MLFLGIWVLLVDGFHSKIHSRFVLSWENELILVKACEITFIAVHQAPVVQTMNSAIHRINHYPVDKS